jgi:hypothetical protein
MERGQYKPRNNTMQSEEPEDNLILQFPPTGSWKINNPGTCTLGKRASISRGACRAAIEEYV